MLDFCLVAIFKNESEILREWIEHYIREGCSKFFLIDNDSDDNYLPIIEKYCNSGKVELIKDPQKHAQKDLYNKYFLSKIKEYEWTLICDLDEFVYSRNDFNTIKDFLSSVKPDISQIAIPWKIFGSNGFDKLDKKEPKSVIDTFTKRMDYSKKEGFQGVSYIKEDVKMNLCKCIVRSEKVISMDLHYSIKNDDMTIDDMTIDSRYQVLKCLPHIPCNEEILEASNLQLNHYAIRSLDWFTRVKMTRGSATSVKAGNIKGKIDYFYSFDKVSNDIDDIEVRDKKSRMIII